MQNEPAGTITITDTLQSIVVAFIFAFLFKHFVAEAYVIPTGSMAPTLRGAHLVAHSPDSGYEYAVGPDTVDRNTGMAHPIQAQDGITLSDPMLDNLVYMRRPQNGPKPETFKNAKIRMGDRIFVLRYLYSLFEPQRFDVSVFKFPKNPTQNFIKRLIGLPNETVWLADGDVFARPDDAVDESTTGSFTIQRKPDHVQKAVWQPVFYSQYIPRDPSIYRPEWAPPWVGGDGWDLSTASYTYSGTQKTSLRYHNELKPIEDRCVYNESGSRNVPRGRYPVSDIRVAASVLPEQAGLESTIRLRCRAHTFEAVISSEQVVIRMRPDSNTSLDDQTADWVILETNLINDPLSEGKLTSVEFWHVDQSIHLWINGTKIAYAEYDWDADKRMLFATGISGTEALDRDFTGNIYEQLSSLPKSPTVTWEFEGSPLTLHKLELDRDIYYQPSHYRRGDRIGEPSLATHPSQLAVLSKDQFFFCGDNSPASNDGRTWQPPHPWIASEFDGAQGIVPRKLLLGKAFFVYYPSPEGLSEDGFRFIPNFGEMRFIR